MVRGDSWIIDGNFGGTRAVRLKACDTVILLDLPRYVCLYRVIKRSIRFYGRSRPDMGAGCDEKIDLEFLSWVWNFPRRGRTKVFEEVRTFPEKRFVILRSEREKDEFLHDVAGRSAWNGDGNQS